MAKVKIDEMLGLCTEAVSCDPQRQSRAYQHLHTMSDKAAKVAPHNAVPRGPLTLIKLEPQREMLVLSCLKLRLMLLGNFARKD